MLDGVEPLGSVGLGEGAAAEGVDKRVGFLAAGTQARRAEVVACRATIVKLVVATSGKAPGAGVVCKVGVGVEGRIRGSSMARC